MSGNATLPLRDRRRFLWPAILATLLNPFLLFDLSVAVLLGRAAPGLSVVALAGPLGLGLFVATLLLPFLGLGLARSWPFGVVLWLAVLTLASWPMSVGFAFGATLDGLRLDAGGLLGKLFLIHIAWTLALAAGAFGSLLRRDRRP
ncbi:hypothetical protein [Falsiroseomonas sp.]|uniref:hypothetical protein n=1 Tax=Falsiroseomonas sp. TaxID=2870721 RepID=UPI003566763F